MLSVVFSKKKIPTHGRDIDGEKELTAVAEDPQQHQEQVDESPDQREHPTKGTLLNGLAARGLTSGHPTFYLFACHPPQLPKHN
ncbi:hypothetical protein ACISSW_19155, partial [Escherichia coli]